MNYLKKIFSRSKQNEKQQRKKIQKPSFLTWLCSSKSIQYQTQHCPSYTRAKSIQLQPSQSTKKSTISIAPTNSTKIIQSLSFGHNTYREFLQQDLRSRLVGIEEKLIDNIGELVDEEGLYGVVNSEETIGIWLKIGKHEQINSLTHIKPYYFTRIFIVMNQQLPNDFNIQQILLSKQNILLKLQHPLTTQQVINLYENQLIEHFAFKPLSQCFPKLKLTVYKIKKERCVWLQFNHNNKQMHVHTQEILEQIGFRSDNSLEYEKLKEEIPSALTLQEYMEFTEQKNKLMTKYEGENIDEYIRNKFLQKVNSKSVRNNTDSPRTLEKDKSNQQVKSQSSGYNEYILSMTANTLPIEPIANSKDYPQGTNQLSFKQIQKNSYQQQIFEFKIYKQDRQQQEKRVAINKQRKKRSRSEDINNDNLNNCDDDLDGESDYFDKRD